MENKFLRPGISQLLRDKVQTSALINDVQELRRNVFDVQANSIQSTNEVSLKLQNQINGLVYDIQNLHSNAVAVQKQLKLVAYYSAASTVLSLGILAWKLFL